MLHIIHRFCVFSGCHRPGQALLVMSENLNKGFDSMQQAGTEITKVNQVIHKQIQ